MCILALFALLEDPGAIIMDQTASLAFVQMHTKILILKSLQYEFEINNNT